jgi:hypothetical protein
MAIFVFANGINPFTCPSFREELATNFVNEFDKINEAIPGGLAAPPLFGFLTGKLVAASVDGVAIGTAIKAAPTILVIRAGGALGRLVFKEIVFAVARAAVWNFVVAQVGFEIGISIVSLDNAINKAIDSALEKDSCDS